MTDLHRVPAEELNLGDMSASGREFSGAVIFVGIDRDKNNVHIFTDAQRQPGQALYKESPHWGFAFPLGKELDLDLGASENRRAKWVADDFKAMSYGQDVELAYRARIAQKKARPE